MNEGTEVCKPLDKDGVSLVELENNRYLKGNLNSCVLVTEVRPTVLGVGEEVPVLFFYALPRDVALLAHYGGVLLMPGYFPTLVEVYFGNDV